jgi:hypothetical protein
MYPASKESKEFLELLRNYHKVTTKRGEVRIMLAREHDIQVRYVLGPFMFLASLSFMADTLSERTISRRWKEMGLKSARGGEAEMTREEVVQLVTDQLKQVPSDRRGRLHFIKSEIALKSGIHLKKCESFCLCSHPAHTHTFIRKTVREVMDMLEPPTTARASKAPKRTRPSSLVSAGSNEVWIYDGYDGLCDYGFAIWGARDKFSRKWLGLWVLPIDHIADAVAYRWLSLVHKHEGKKPVYQRLLTYTHFH